MAYDRFNNITLQQMKALVRLVEERSFSQAAKKMYLTQPSLTKHIKNLEESVNATVVNRKNTGISLTPEGKILYDYAQRVFKLMGEAREKIARVKEDESGSIFISASTIPSTYILPHVIQAFNKRYPDIRCYVQTNDSDATLNMILDNQAEIGFIGRPVLNRKLHADAVWSDRLVLVVPEGHKWGRKASVTIDELSREPFIIREKGSATRSILEDYLQTNTDKALSQFNIICELGSSEAVKEAIIAGLGVSILSDRAVGRELAGGLLVQRPVENCIIERNFYLIYKKHLSLMRHHTLFMDSVRESEHGHSF
ncbi:MAG: selenium metabolism-associated LysR family transcriptional regulator [Syntrophales bacterium]|nr:selenium metabolism-associated LysR family transcriptional regulator [Syntrophales bacterium]